MESTQQLEQTKTLTKTVNAVKTAKKYDEFENVFVANSGQPDIVDEMIPVSAWNLDRFKANPVIFYQHSGYYSNDPDNIIARGRAFPEGDQLMIGIEKYDSTERAQEIKRKVNEDFINAVSVGFAERSPGEMVAVGDKSIYKFKDVELLEVSIVNVPADPKATRVKTATGKQHTRPESKSVDNVKTSKDSDEMIAQKKRYVKNLTTQSKQILTKTNWNETE